MFIPTAVIARAAEQSATPPVFDASLVGWWDASDLSTISESGGLVSTWADKSSSGYDATAAGDARPTTGTRTQNGRNVIDFDGSSDYFTTSAPADDEIATTFVVGFADDTVSTYHGIYGPSASGGSALRTNQTTGAIQLEKDAISALITSTQLGPGNTYPFLYVIKEDSSFPLSAIMKVGTNGGYGEFGLYTATTTDDPNYTVGRTLEIGRAASGPWYWDGWIAELLRYDVALDTLSIFETVAWLADRWAV